MTNSNGEVWRKPFVFAPTALEDAARVPHGLEAAQSMRSSPHLPERYYPDIQHPKVAGLLQNLVFEEVNPGLGTLAPFIKEVDISAIRPRDIPPQGQLSSWPLKPQLHEDTLLQVLKAFTNRIGIQKLSLQGAIDLNLHWKHLSLAVQNALDSLLRLPSVFTLSFTYVSELPVALLAAYAHLNSLTIANCWDPDREAAPSVRASLPGLGHLDIQCLSTFPGGIDLPSLHTMSARVQYFSDFETTWNIISRARKALKSLTVCHGEVALEISKGLSIQSFPQLQYFDYSDDSIFFREMSLTMRDVLRLFHFSQSVPNLQGVRFFHPEQKAGRVRACNDHRQMRLDGS